MDNRKIGTGEWIVVCDGRKALILENAGDVKFPNLRAKETYSHPDASTHELGASPPGRSHQSTGPGRSAMAQTDWHDEAERAFLKSLVMRLDKAVTAGEIKTVIMIAPPRALGMMRPFYSAAIQHAIAREVKKDMVKAPVQEIEKLLFSKVGA